MMLKPGSQVVDTTWHEPQQFTVIDVSNDCEVLVQSNVQPVMLWIFPGEYRPGVSLYKWER